MDRKEAINKFLEKAKKEINLDAAILFGSTARNESKKDSDIDLIIVPKDFKGKKYFRRAAPLYHLWENEYGVDIICLTPKEFAKKAKEIGVVGEASREGIKVLP